MRKAINENPRVQLAVLGVAALIFAFVLFTKVLGGSSAEPTDSAATDPAATGTTATGAPATPSTDGTATATPSTGATATPATGATTPSTATPPTGTDPSATAPATTPPPTGGAAGTADGLLATKGLPQDLLVAYAMIQAIALLVFDPVSKGAKALQKATEDLSNKKVAVFVVDVKDIARYSRITEGVSVTQAPALVVIRPRKLTGSVPTASVSYGIRGAASVKQAIQDGLYKGGTVPSYP
jgi:hypothetical protein